MSGSRALTALLLIAASCTAAAQDRNIALPVADLEHMLQAEPMRIVTAEISRPKAKGDITLKADVAFADRPPIRVKVRNVVYATPAPNGGAPAPNGPVGAGQRSLDRADHGPSG